MTGDLNRREFLRAGATAAVTAGLPAALGASSKPPAATADSVVVLTLTGGPSHLDTWDPKPLAPSAVRGPFAPIPTRVPGVQFTELFPKMAAMADRFSLIRSMHHTAAPVHEAGFQLLNTGRLFGTGPDWPGVGAVATHLLGDRGGCPAWWHYSDGDVSTGLPVGHGQGAGFLRVPAAAPCRPLTAGGAGREWRFDLACDRAVASVAAGARVVTVNMYSTVFDAVSWDCHAAGGALATDLRDYRDAVAPSFDAAFTSLLAGLEDRGLLGRTLVVATGEFGRTPKLNGSGGRDHWPGCWTALVAGGGVQGGRVVGASDATGSAPADRPVTPPELLATIYRALGLPPQTTIPGPDGMPVRLVGAEPVRELF